MAESERDGRRRYIGTGDLRKLLGVSFKIPRDEQVNIISELVELGLLEQVHKKSFRVNFLSATGNNKIILNTFAFEIGKKHGKSGEKACICEKNNVMGLKIEE